MNQIIEYLKDQIENKKSYLKTLIINHEQNKEHYIEGIESIRDIEELIEGFEKALKLITNYMIKE